MQSSWSVLVVIFCISKEVWSSAKAPFSSVLTILWSFPHMSWCLLLILFCWVSIQKLLLLSLQEAHTLFLYFLQAVQTDTSSVSEHEIQSPKAVSMCESYTLPLDNPELEEARSLVLFRLPAMVPPTRPMVALEGLKGLAGSCPPCSELDPGPVSKTNPGMSWLPQVELDSTPASMSGELTWVLLVWW